MLWRYWEQREESGVAVVNKMVQAIQSMHQEAGDLTSVESTLLLRGLSAGLKR